jgi:RNase P protein component
VRHLVKFALTVGTLLSAASSYSQSSEVAPILKSEEFVPAAMACINGIISKQKNDRAIKRVGWRRVIKGEVSNLYEKGESRTLLIVPKKGFISGPCRVRGHIRGYESQLEFREILSKIRIQYASDFNSELSISSSTYVDQNSETPVIEAQDLLANGIQGQVVLEKSYSGFLVDIIFMRSLR